MVNIRSTAVVLMRDLVCSFAITALYIYYRALYKGVVNMLVVSLAIETFGPSYTHHDLKSVSLLTATEQGDPIRSMTVEVKPPSLLFPDTAVYKVHPSWSGNLQTHDYGALSYAEADGQLVMFILADMQGQGLIKVEDLQAVRGEHDLLRLVTNLADSILVVTEKAYVYMPFIRAYLPILSRLVYHRVIDWSTHRLIMSKGSDVQPVGRGDTPFMKTSTYLQLYRHIVVGSTTSPVASVA